MFKICSEEKKFNEWLEYEKKEKGLIDFHISKEIENIIVNKNGSLNIEYKPITYSREDYFKEFNNINEAIAKGLYQPIINL